MALLMPDYFGRQGVEYVYEHKHIRRGMMPTVKNHELLNRWFQNSAARSDVRDTCHLCHNEAFAEILDRMGAGFTAMPTAEEIAAFSFVDTFDNCNQQVEGNER